jgi:hypothetical protein
MSRCPESIPLRDSKPQSLADVYWTQSLLGLLVIGNYRYTEGNGGPSNGIGVLELQQGMGTSEYGLFVIRRQ